MGLHEPWFTMAMGQQKRVVGEMNVWVAYLVAQHEGDGKDSVGNKTIKRIEEMIEEIEEAL